MRKTTAIALIGFISVGNLAGCGQDSGVESTQSGGTASQSDPSTWPTSQDAQVAAPEDHVILYEDENVRFLSVTQPPGGRGPMHHHRMPSVMIIDSMTQAVDHFPDGTQVPYDRLPPSAQVPTVFVLGPEPAHSWENVDTIPFHLYRLEFKNMEFQNVQDIMEQVQAQME